MTDNENGGSGENLPNGFHELTDEERNPLPPPEPLAVDKQGRRLCGAKCKRTGQPCRQPGMSNGRCKQHGGMTPGGIASPHFRHGKRSKYLKDLPPALKKGYQAALKDPELHSMDDDIALLTSRTGELLRDLSATEAPPWGKVVDALVTFEQAKRGKNQDKSDDAFGELSKLIRQGADAAQSREQIWSDLMETISLKGRTAQAEHKRQVDLGSLVSAEDALMLLTTILERTKNVLENRLDDPQQARQVMSEVARQVHDMLPIPPPRVIDHEEP